MKLGRTAIRVTSAVLLGFSVILPLNPASASTPLTRAVVEALRNQVRLMQSNRSPRPANLSDVLTPGDGVATGQSSRAELRFNDGSLARVGEQVVFWFTPQTRTFRLSNGTVLMLIPPGQGGTRIQTPNVTTGIRGSALFVRVDAETNTTLVGALTNSGIEVFNADATEQLELQAGQMAVVVDNTIQGLYEFDLETFYETSPLVEDLKLNQAVTEEEMSALSEEERAIAKVREETTSALQAQQVDDVAVETPQSNPNSSSAEEPANAGVDVEALPVEVDNTTDAGVVNLMDVVNNRPNSPGLGGGVGNGNGNGNGGVGNGNGNGNGNGGVGNGNGNGGVGNGNGNGGVGNGNGNGNGGVGVGNGNGGVGNGNGGVGNGNGNGNGGVGNGNGGVGVGNGNGGVGNGNGGVGNGNGNGGVGNGNGGVGNGNGNGGIGNGNGGVGNGGVGNGNGNGNGGVGNGNGGIGNGNGFPGQGNGVDGVFPGQGNGVDGGFPGQGNGVSGGFPGQGIGVSGGLSSQGIGVEAGVSNQGIGLTRDLPIQSNNDESSSSTQSDSSFWGGWSILTGD